MASVFSGNTFYVDSASSSGTPGSYINSKDLKVLAIYFSGTTAGDSVIISDLKMLNDAATPSAGSTKIKVTSDVNNKPVLLRLGETPLRFSAGLWITSISASATATLVIDKAS